MSALLLTVLVVICGARCEMGNGYTVTRVHVSVVSSEGDIGNPSVLSPPVGYINLKPPTRPTNLM